MSDHQTDLAQNGVIEVPDQSVIDHWKSSDFSGVNETAKITPDWYEENGTPMDSDGEDMVYVKTEINLEGVSNEDIEQGRVVITHHWQSPDRPDAVGETAEIPPGWVEENGTPMDSDGEDMVYVKTTIFRNAPDLDDQLDLLESENPENHESMNP